MSDTMEAASLAARRLTGALDEVSEALAAADLDRLLAAEAVVAAAVAAFTPPFPPPSDPDSLTAETAALQRALARCRRLGAALDDVVHASRTAVEPTAAYDRSGRERAGLSTPTAWEARI